MKVVYRPADGEAREWSYEPNRMLSVEAEAIERVTGWTYQEFGEKFMAGSAMAQHALLWVLLRRENRSLKYAEVKFTMDEFDIAFDTEELAQMRDALNDPNSELSDDDRDTLEKYLSVAEEKPETEEPDPTKSEE